MNSRIPSWFAPAKLNLFLHITSQRNDGYHNLQTLFQLLDYGDELRFISRQDNNFVAKYAIEGINPDNDLILKAAKLLFQYIKDKNLFNQKKSYGVDIFLQKKLPMGGGLGGGSSDAATTLKALNQIWNIHLDKKTLAELGLKIGADVPIFVLGENCWAEGVGDKLIPYAIPESYFIVVMPDINICTADLFSHKDLQRNCKPITQYNFEQTKNVFEYIVRQKYPKIEQAFEFLSLYAKPRLTGTGACVFISKPTKAECIAIIDCLPAGLQAFYAKGLYSLTD